MLETCLLHWSSPFLGTPYRTQSYFLPLPIVTERKKAFFRASLPGFIHLSIHYYLAIIWTSFSMSYFRKICFLQESSLSCFFVLTERKKLAFFYPSIDSLIHSLLSAGYNLELVFNVILSKDMFLARSVPFFFFVVTEGKITFFRASLPGFIHFFIHYCLVTMLTWCSRSCVWMTCTLQGPFLFSLQEKRPVVAFLPFYCDRRKKNTFFPSFIHSLSSGYNFDFVFMVILSKDLFITRKVISTTAFVFFYCHRTKKKHILLRIQAFIYSVLFWLFIC